MGCFGGMHWRAVLLDWSAARNVGNAGNARTEGRLDRLLYHREWAKKHPGYKTADSRLRALFRSARPFFREILGVKVRVNLLAEVLREAGGKEENGNVCLRYNAAQQLFNGNKE
jgi:hypothetical protein